jgi:hypothetical protein
VVGDVPLVSGEHPPCLVVGYRGWGIGSLRPWLICLLIQSGGWIRPIGKSDKTTSQLERLAVRHKGGDLTDEEFRVAKARFLGL